LSGRPLAYVLGRHSFYGREFLVEPGVLIPRQETETLVELAVDELGKTPDGRTIVDLGCGTGCIGLTLVAEVADSYAMLVDNNPRAVAITAKNAKNLKMPMKLKIVQHSVEDLDPATIEPAAIV